MDALETLDEPVEAIVQSVEMNIDTDSIGAQKDKQKRVVKLTAKALAEKFQRLQASRKAKLHKEGRLREKMQALMKTKEKVKVQCVFEDFHLCDEAQHIHGSLVDILPDEEKEKHSILFKAKMICNNEFITDVTKWLSGATQGSNDDVDDNINTEDIVSNVASRHSSRKTSKSSTTSSARTRVREEAE